MPAASTWSALPPSSPTTLCFTVSASRSSTPTSSAVRVLEALSGLLSTRVFSPENTTMVSIFTYCLIAGIPDGSRFATNKDFFNDTVKQLQSDEGKVKIQKVRDLTKVAEEIGTSMTNLALAWTLLNKNVSTCILGATKPEQLKENVKALDVYKQLVDKPDVVAKINKILDNKPKLPVSYGRMDAEGNLA